MILDYFSLREQPFGVTPDPGFWFASATHREALASLLYGLESKRGFVVLVAKPGMGKTTVLFNGLKQLGDEMRTVFLFQQLTTAESLLRAILAGLDRNETEGDLTQLQRTLNDVCAEQARLGRHIVAVIDEAQNLDESVLAFVCMLSNFETARGKLIQVVLSGQPQLAEKLAAERVAQLRQRISILAHLRPLTQFETAAYVNHRLRAAGFSSTKDLFTPSAMAMIAKESQGIPRDINNLCFNAMSVGFALRRKTIDCEIVREMIADLNLGPIPAKSREISKPPAHEPVYDVDQRLRKQAQVVRPFVEKVMEYLNQWEQKSDREFALNPPVCEVTATGRSQTPGANRVEAVQPAARRWPGFQLLKSAKASFSAFRKRFNPNSSYRVTWTGILIVIAASVLDISFWGKDSAEAAKISAMPSVSTSESISASFLAAPVPTDLPAPSTIAVAVKPGKFLEGIRTEHFANGLPLLLQRILNLNPEIDDPNYIVAGQLPRIPAGNTIVAASTQTDRMVGTKGITPSRLYPRINQYAAAARLHENRRKLSSWTTSVRSDT
ncbi:MAG: AAA family ATPase [Terracidiphilus sp.]